MNRSGHQDHGELWAEVQRWIDDDVDPDSVEELRRLLAVGATDSAGAAEAVGELEDRFRGPLTFGTAGLRGPLRAGPNGMNRAVVRRAAAGVASWLSDRGEGGRGGGSPGGGRVVVGYDARHGSRDFAYDSAAIFAAEGFDALLMPRLLPTPVLAFAVQYLHAVAGVMVTASHNPPRDNGYKVYSGDGAQIAPPSDVEIETAIRAVGPTRDIPLDSHRVTLLDDTVVSAYVDAIAGLLRPGPRDLRIVHTAMHGVGTEVLRTVFAAAGFSRPIAVAEQEAPDPDFPTVAFPNPEEPGALDLAMALARSRGADLIIANDPDADRCAVAVPHGDGEWLGLRGDQVGVLLADCLLRKGIRGTYATTIVSSSMLRAMAARNGVGYAETLTGFKWLARAAPDLVYGYEEALGYAVAPELVRDKDGISAAVVIAELAADLKARGTSVPERLEELAAEYGRHVTDQLSVRVDDPAIIDDAMARLRAHPPATLLGRAVAVTDLQPQTDAVRLSWDGGRVVVRPSGTEPKLKAYLEVVPADGSPETADRQIVQLRAEMTSALGL